MVNVVPSNRLLHLGWEQRRMNHRRTTEAGIVPATDAVLGTDGSHDEPGSGSSPQAPERTAAAELAVARVLRRRGAARRLPEQRNRPERQRLFSPGLASAGTAGDRPGRGPAPAGGRHRARRRAAGDSLRPGQGPPGVRGSVVGRPGRRHGGRGLRHHRAAAFHLDGRRPARRGRRPPAPGLGTVVGRPAGQPVRAGHRAQPVQARHAVRPAAPHRCGAALNATARPGPHAPHRPNRQHRPGNQHGDSGQHPDKNQRRRPLLVGYGPT